MERRELLRWAAASAGIAGLQGLTSRQLVSFGERVHRAAGEGSLHVLDAHAAATVTAAAERILPRTDTPGATDAGVTAFVDTMLDGWYPQPDRDRFLQGLADLDARSRAHGGHDFIALSTADQVAVLTALDDELTSFRRARPAGQATPWFDLLKYLTIYGYCTSQPGATKGLGIWPKPWRYEPCAPLPVTKGS